MSARQRLLPLFPLNVVLFPNALLPLHIFEERYKTMVQHCLDGDSRFGVALIKSGAEVGEPAEPHPIGTIGRIVRVQHLDEGKMNIAVAGEERFWIDEITQTHPYTEAYVEVLDDEGEGDADVPAADLTAVWDGACERVSLMLGLAGGWAREPTVPQGPAQLSFFVGQMLQIDTTEKQALLEETSTAARLRRGLELLVREAPPLKERVAKELAGRFSVQ